MLFMCNVFAFAALHVFFVKGQQQQQPVLVGLQGGTYTPPTVAVVTANNSIIFEFFGNVHSVTQSSFEDPCALLPGGFHSGYQGRGPNLTEPVMVWELFINDTSVPIFFFCAATSPDFHCSAGMVGAINVQNQGVYNSYSSAARAVTTTAQIGSSPILLGSNAFATDTPTISVLTVTPTSTPPTSSSTSSPTSTAPSTTPNLGAIVGGTVGGTIALIAFIVSFWYFCLRSRQAPETVQNDSDEFFRYNSVPALNQHPNEVFPGTVGSGNFNHNSNTNASTVPTPHLTPLRRPSGPVIDPPYLHQQSNQSNNVDIRALAQEVAAVLYQNPATNYSSDPRGQMSVVRNHDYANATYQPPSYRTDPSGFTSSDIPRNTPYI